VKNEFSDTSNQRGAKSSEIRQCREGISLAEKIELKGGENALKSPLNASGGEVNGI
jgi:hypothetical protein